MRYPHLMMFALWLPFAACGPEPANTERWTDWTTGFDKADFGGQQGFDFIPEAEIPQALEEYLLPLFLSGIQGSFSGQPSEGQPVQISFVKYPPLDGSEPTGALVVLQGRSEAQTKYVELIHDLGIFRANGYTVYLLDHRGQGFSDRLVPWQDKSTEREQWYEHDKGYIDNWDHYVADVKTLVETIVRQDLNSAGENPKIFAYGHSMGGAILAQYAVTYPTDFNAIVLSSPMLHAQLDGWSEWTVESWAWMGTPSDYFDDEKYGPWTAEDYTEDNPYTHSPNRFRMEQRIFAELYPQSRLGGVTNGWLNRSIDAAQWLRDQAENLTTPTLMMIAGADTKVFPEDEREFCDASPACTPKEFPSARHELHNERDDIRKKAIKAARDFFIETHGAFSQ